MVKGDIPYKRKMYTGLQLGSGNIKVVSPTEAVVQQAKSDLKRSLQEADVYKPKRARFLLQSGEGVKKRKKRKYTKRNSKNKNNSKRKVKRKPKRRKKTIASKSGKQKRRKNKKNKKRRSTTTKRRGKK